MKYNYYIFFSIKYKLKFILSYFINKFNKTCILSIELIKIFNMPTYIVIIFFVYINILYFNKKLIFLKLMFSIKIIFKIFNI